VVTDRAPVYPTLVDDLFPAAWHHSEQYGNNRIEADHGRLTRRLRPMRHLRNDARRRWLLPAMPSCRTYAAVTTT